VRMQRAETLRRMRPRHTDERRAGADGPDRSVCIMPSAAGVLGPDSLVGPCDRDIRVRPHRIEHRLQKMRLPPVVVLENRTNGWRASATRRLNVAAPPEFWACGT